MKCIKQGTKQIIKYRNVLQKVPMLSIIDPRRRAKLEEIFLDGIDQKYHS